MNKIVTCAGNRADYTGNCVENGKSFNFAVNIIKQQSPLFVP